MVILAWGNEKMIHQYRKEKSQGEFGSKKTHHRGIVSRIIYQTFKRGLFNPLMVL